MFLLNKHRQVLVNLPMFLFQGFVNYCVEKNRDEVVFVFYFVLVIDEFQGRTIVSRKQLVQKVKEEKQGASNNKKGVLFSNSTTSMCCQKTGVKMKQEHYVNKGFQEGDKQVV